VLSREVDLDVTIDEWEPESHLNFTVNGLTEQIAGGGTFRLSDATAGTGGGSGTGGGPGTGDDTGTGGGPGMGGGRSVREPARGRLGRLWGRLMFALIRRSARRRSAAARTGGGGIGGGAPGGGVPGGGVPGAPESRAASASASGDREGDRESSGTGSRSQLTFHLEVAPGGPMAPMIELLMSPLLEPAAEDLAVGIRKELERQER
jgi:hypothetical protein